MTDFTAARLNMVESQVRPNGITDRRIIAAVERLPREAFVPEGKRAVAYMDEDVLLEPADKSAGPRALIEVMAFARMLQHAAIKPEDRVLVVGAGTGYGAAVIAALAQRTVALECDAALAAAARRNLEGVAGVSVVEGPLAAEVRSQQRQVADHQPGGVDGIRFAVLRVDAVVADVGVGQGNDLTRVGRVGQDFLVTGHRGIEDHLADAAAAGAYAFSSKNRSVGQGKKGGRKVRHDGAPGTRRFSDRNRTSHDSHDVRQTGEL